VSWLRVFSRTYHIITLTKFSVDNRDYLEPVIYIRNFTEPRFDGQGRGISIFVRNLGYYGWLFEARIKWLYMEKYGIHVGYTI
jgi:hypothetical protein